MDKTLRSARAFVIISLLWNEITFLNLIAYLADIIYNPLLSNSIESFLRLQKNYWIQKTTMEAGVKFHDLHIRNIALKKIFNTRFTTFSIFCLIYYYLLCKQNKLIQSGFSFKVTNTALREPTISFIRLLLTETVVPEIQYL